MPWGSWDSIGRGGASGSGHVEGPSGNGWGALPTNTNPNLGNDLLNFFKNLSGGNNYGSGSGSGYGRGSGGFGGGGAAPQQIDPLDLQAWDAQLGLQQRQYNQAKQFLPEVWKDTLAKLSNTTQTAKRGYNELKYGLDLQRGTTKRNLAETLRDLGQGRDDSLYNLFSDATARGAITAQGTGRQQGIIGREYGEGVGTANANALDQLRNYALQQRSGKFNLSDQLKDIALSRRAATRQHLQDKLQLDTMANQFYFDTAARNQVQGQIGGIPIPYINVPAAAGQVTHLGGIGMRF